MLKPLNDRRGRSKGDRLISRGRKERRIKFGDPNATKFLEHLPDPVIVVDSSGSIVFSNGRTESVLGYSPDDLAGKPVEILVPVKLRESHMRHRQKYMKSPEPRSLESGMELTAKRKDGSEVPVDVSLSPFKSEGETFVVCVIRDIHIRKNLEKQFVLSQRMETIGRIADGIAHDFNNLLTGILGYAELLRKNVPPEMRDAQGDILEIKKGAEFAADLTRQFLAYSGHEIMKPQILCLSETLTRMDNMLRRLIGGEVELEMRIEPDVWMTQVDPAQMDQIVMNLATNARDAMPSGGKLILELRNVSISEKTPTVGVEMPEGEYVRLTLRDTGEGIPSHVLPRIFEPFFTTKAGGKGTGLGLATSLGIIRRNRGYLTAESLPGEGTTFRIFLPKLSELPPTVSPDGLPPDESYRGFETVLLVEDETRLREMVGKILEQLGYRVLIAESVGDAMAIAQKQIDPIHLLLTDVVMPVMNGRDLAKVVRALRPDIKCLFMSGYTDDVLELHGIPEQGIHFIQKPFLPHELAGEIRKTLEDRTPAMN